MLGSFAIWECPVELLRGKVLRLGFFPFRLLQLLHFWTKGMDCWCLAFAAPQLGPFGIGVRSATIETPPVDWKVLCGLSPPLCPVLAVVFGDLGIALGPAIDLLLHVLLILPLVFAAALLSISFALALVAAKASTFGAHAQLLEEVL